MQVISLNGSWKFRAKNSRARLKGRLKGQVPGTVHKDLLATGKIGDPFYRDNEKHLQWIGETNWIYTRKFQVRNKLLEHPRVLLRCKGLDTVAIVRLNGKKIASTANMHRTWEWDIKELLKPGYNLIEIEFEAAGKIVRQQHQKHPLPGWYGTMVQQGFNWLRKEACNFGWDWGPVLVTWIPGDAIVTRFSASDYEKRLQDAVDANMNMLRVWGGGIYEEDCFYDLCDEVKGVRSWKRGQVLI